MGGSPKKPPSSVKIMSPSSRLRMLPSGLRRIVWMCVAGERLDGKKRTKRFGFVVDRGDQQNRCLPKRAGS